MTNNDTPHIPQEVMDRIKEVGAKFVYFADLGQNQALILADIDPEALNTLEGIPSEKIMGSFQVINNAVTLPYLKNTEYQASEDTPK